MKITWKNYSECVEPFIPSEFGIISESERNNERYAIYVLGDYFGSIEFEGKVAALEPALSEKALAIARDIVKTKAGALKLLQGAGILDEHGNHTEPYR